MHDNIGEHLKPEDSSWILVDHNKLQGTLGAVYGSCVHGVIDHHDEENAVPKDTDPEPRVIEKCGSCTSLVVRYLRSSWDAMSSSSLSSGVGHAQGDSLVDDGVVSRVWDAQAGKMALASILVDTRNLTDENKVTKVDHEAVAYLTSKIKLSPKEACTWDQAEYFKAIDGAKGNIDSLSLANILRKDYKEWREGDLKLGISSVVKPLSFLASKAHIEHSGKKAEAAFDTAIRTFAEDRDLNVFAIMTTSTSSKGEFQRELLLESNDRGNQAAARFENQASKELGLEHMAISEIQDSDKAFDGRSWRRVWRQKEVGKSRKQVAPLLRKAMRSD